MKNSKNNSKELKVYLGKIKREVEKLKYSASMRHVIFKEIKRNLSEHIKEADSDSIDFVEFFGTPESAVVYYETLENADALKKEAKKYLILKIVFMAFAVVVVIVIASLIYALTQDTGSTNIIDPHT